MEPYAVHLLRRFKAGETVEQLAASEGIPRDRIIIRLAAARGYERAKAPIWQKAPQELPVEIAA